VATLVPIDLVLVGKTSDANTQLTGPKLKEKNILSMKIIATPALDKDGELMTMNFQCKESHRCAATLTVPWTPSGRGGLVATIAARIAYNTTKTVAPNKRGFFRPTRSRKSVMKL